MKKTMLLMLPFFVAIVAIAQPPHPAGKPGKGPGGKAGMEMMKDIDLTPEQKVAMQKLQDELRQQMQALNSNESITVKEQRDRREALLKKHKEAVDKLLTADQKKQLADKRAKARAKAGEMQAQHLAKMADKLQLSTEQVAKVNASHTTVKTKMDAVLKNDKLSREERKASMDKIKAEHEQAMASILNADQLKQWKELRQQGPKPGMHKGGKGMHRHHEGMRNGPAAVR